MPLTTGSRLSHYEILSALGAGGMGEVYKARDTRLDRIVAIKVLPEPFATDADRRERFEREARAVAALNHPHICQLHDVGEADGVRFLVMEHLEGQTLEDRLVRGALPIAEALRVAIDVADALDHAHRRGLVHRDLKPGNIMLTKSGAKLLDFGVSRFQVRPDLMAMATVTADRAPITAEGAVLGTYPYMAPEQLAGREADARSDIFGFGAVLYEMITGRRAFEGATAATLLGAILHTDPPALSSQRPLVPVGLDRLASRCLAKDPDDRWQTARDLALELKWIADQTIPEVVARGGRRPSMTASIVTIVLAAAAIVMAVTVTYMRGAPAETPAVQLAFMAPKGVTLADPRLSGPVSISPNGRLVAFVGIGGDGRPLLWVRALESSSAQPLPGTEGAGYPFWSPDSRFIGFFAQRKLKKIAATGGPSRELCDAVQPRGGTWGRTGVIIFSAGLGYELYRVAEGGPAVAIPEDGRNQERAWPSFLPDGRHFVYFGRPQKHGIYLGDLDSPETKELLSDYVSAVYSPPGYLLVLKGSSKAAQATTVMAQRIDPTRFEIVGEPSPVAEPVSYAPGLGRGAFSASQTGTLVYSTTERPTSELIWFDRAGQPLGAVGGSLSSYYAPSLSPDGRTIAAARLDPETGTPDLWRIDAARGVNERLTLDPREDLFANWSPDGDRIVFSAQSAGTPPNLFQKAVGTSSNREEQLFRSRLNSQPTDWSRDGRFIIYARRDPQTQWDLWLWPMFRGADQKEMPYLRSAANEHLAQFSPDGTGVAYVSDESGVDEVYAESFPTPGTRVQISTGGGTQPRWNGDGSELFYIAADGYLMAVAVRQGSRVQASAPSRLFKPRIFDFFRAQNNGYYWNYAVARDGKRFLISTLTEESTNPSTTVVLNWFARLTQR